MDGVKRFKEGAFLHAQQSKVPILPVVIEGSKDIFPKACHNQP
jgi:1-acyl-sn-glycerol-3-phosphate acyltransferase